MYIFIQLYNIYMLYIQLYNIYMLYIQLYNLYMLYIDCRVHKLFYKLYDISKVGSNTYIIIRHNILYIIIMN